MSDLCNNLAKLPAICASRLFSDGSPILIRRGETGYYPAPFPDFDVDAFNRRKGVTPAQREAMLGGSMFGWHLPIADPDNRVNNKPEGA